LRPRTRFHISRECDQSHKHLTQHTPGPGVSCLRSSPADGHTLLTFLSHGANGARFLYLTKWSDDLRLAGCEIYSNPDVAAGYRAFCDRNETWDQELVKKFSISLLLFPDAPCALVRSVVPTPELTGRRRTDETERKTRRKRSWIFPGTLWCGTGSKAAGYEQLGMFERADKCCREHDHCSDIIPAFTVNYGVFNPNFFTVSHCECDQRFRQCLLGMNDSISSMVGYSFFNILKVPCFELKQLKHCTQMYWWGICLTVKEIMVFPTLHTALYSIFPTPTTINNQNLIKKGQRSNLYNEVDGCNFLEAMFYTVEQNVKQVISKNRESLSSLCSRHLSHYCLSCGCIILCSSDCTTFLSHFKKNSRDLSYYGGSKSISRGKHVHTDGKNLTSSKDQHLSQRPASNPQRKASQSKHRCGLRDPPRGDTFHRRRTKANGCKRQGTPSQETLATVWSAATVATPITREQKMMASLHKKDKPQKQLDFHVLWKQAGQQPLGHTTTQRIRAENVLVKNDEKQITFILTNKSFSSSDNELLCRSLKHLDDCKFKIPPLAKKYNLTNMKSKTAYHCDCTSRLAVQIKNVKKPSPPRSLLREFVSQDCFTLPKENKCNRTKRCSGGFTKASELHQALRKREEEKDSAAMRFSTSGRKKRIPLRLHKYCLRLQMRADIMAQLK
uniref:phospholipase A2 n=1 Tax=Poecilia formosa TaxID=48698 RepID=A0A087Y977_POEFO